MLKQHLRLYYLISPVFTFKNMTRKFKIIYVACIIFLLGITGLKGCGCFVVFMMTGGRDYEGIYFLFVKTYLDIFLQ